MLAWRFTALPTFSIPCTAGIRSIGVPLIKSYSAVANEREIAKQGPSLEVANGVRPKGHLQPAASKVATTARQPVMPIS